MWSRTVETAVKLGFATNRGSVDGNVVPAADGTKPTFPVFSERPDVGTTIDAGSTVAIVTDSDDREIYVVLGAGTGSGVLAITAKLEFPFLEVLASDKSTKALNVAVTNAKALKANIRLIEANLIGHQNNLDYILANLPYIPTGGDVSPEVHFEPALALYSGKSGLELIRRLAPMAKNALKNGGYVLLESLPDQHKKVQVIYEKSGFKLTAFSGLVQCFQKL